MTDSMAAQTMKKINIDGIFVGADRIASNGDTANKIGTYSLAVLAKYHGVPFYVAAPLSTVDYDIGSGADIPVEERSPEEVTRIKGVQFTIEDIDVTTPAFDVTPAELIDGIITEKGIAKYPYKKSLGEQQHFS
jgi:methylthioribose-1-phosphate isomerase